MVVMCPLQDTIVLQADRMKVWHLTWNLFCYDCPQKLLIPSVLPRKVFCDFVPHGTWCLQQHVHLIQGRIKMYWLHQNIAHFHSILLTFRATTSLHLLIWSIIAIICAIANHRKPMFHIDTPELFLIGQNNNASCWKDAMSTWSLFSKVPSLPGTRLGVALSGSLKLNEGQLRNVSSGVNLSVSNRHTLLCPQTIETRNNHEWVTATCYTNIEKRNRKLGSHSLHNVWDDEHKGNKSHSVFVKSETNWLQTVANTSCHQGRYINWYKLWQTVVQQMDLVIKTYWHTPSVQPVSSSWCPLCELQFVVNLLFFVILARFELVLPFLGNVTAAELISLSLQCNQTKAQSFCSGFLSGKQNASCTFQHKHKQGGFVLGLWSYLLKLCAVLSANF